MDTVYLKMAGHQGLRGAWVAAGRATSWTEQLRQQGAGLLRPRVGSRVVAHAMQVLQRGGAADLAFWSAAWASGRSTEASWASALWVCSPDPEMLPALPVFVAPWAARQHKHGQRPARAHSARSCTCPALLTRVATVCRAWCARGGRRAGRRRRAAPGRAPPAA